ncbi:C2H2 type zinc finger protein [Colletotrichum higginsianum IMI 349063]|uniref:C2H2 type zinc finger protein n=1 Tax=Colletotrichum higginsianum (strain IMI 349063) TaxID=759273 RepID=A0A1B7YIV6_COLHI|nr:C2H2 type zinc finger protein [Colletotrichum higginsianum IMI 349063]OBR11768.1 C2H2 type zinc finger protein [Colletotrichum higginsianum IMI 349063]
MDHSEPSKGRRPAPHEAMRCNVCDELFASFDKLMGHKRMTMKLEGTHIHCPVCTLDFNTMDAKDKHILEQKLVCPGCQKSFVRLAAWMRHLEHDQCSAIGRQDLDRNRAHKLTFAHELEKRSGSQFGDYFPASHPSVQSAFDKPYMAHPSYFKPDDFPARGKQQDDKLEAQKNARPAVEKSAAADDINNPSHPSFDPKKYYDAIILKFKCPQASCRSACLHIIHHEERVDKKQTNRKSFDTSRGLVTHMKAATSHYNAKLQCPGCLRYFRDTSSLTAHSESETNRCSIRHSENYRNYLDQLTGGMADVADWHRDGTVKYEVSTEAVIKFGTEQAKKATNDFIAKQEANQQESWARNNPIW